MHQELLGCSKLVISNLLINSRVFAYSTQYTIKPNNQTSASPTLGDRPRLNQERFKSKRLKTTTSLSSISISFEAFTSFQRRRNLAALSVPSAIHQPQTKQPNLLSSRDFSPFPKSARIGIANYYISRFPSHLISLGALGTPQQI
ncbi:hypothetical protein ACJJTC_013377 [Scirpophaga incertulas]